MLPRTFNHRSTAPVVLLGSAGAGMQAAAGILDDLGQFYVGLDQTYSSTDQQLRPWSVEHLPEHIHSCIYSAAIPPGDAVLQAVQQKADCIPLADFIADVFQDRQQICVAGTHGKTTTSAMIAWILKATGHDPSWFIGADFANGWKNGRCGQGRFAIIESCEFQQTFLKYSPSIGVVTGIERDHFDCYPDRNSEDDAYRSFLNSVSGQMVVNRNCQRSVGLLPDSADAIFFETGRNQNHSSTTLRISKDASAESSQTVIRASTSVQATAALTSSEWSLKFADARSGHPNVVEQILKLPMPGHHNLSNAIAAIAAANSVGVTIDDSIAALNTFPGIERRFQDCGTFQGAQLIDDYAHHPTALQTTLQAARQRYPGRRIVAVFEPHQVSRTENLFADFVKSLKQADEVMLLPAFPARETVSFADCCRASGKLVRALNAEGARAFLLANLDQTVARIEYSARPSDVILTMGAGRTHLIHDHLHRRLQRHSVA